MRTPTKHNLKARKLKRWAKKHNYTDGAPPRYTTTMDNKSRGEIDSMMERGAYKLPQNLAPHMIVGSRKQK